MTLPLAPSAVSFRPSADDPAVFEVVVRPGPAVCAAALARLRSLIGECPLRPLSGFAASFDFDDGWAWALDVPGLEGCAASVDLAAGEVRLVPPVVMADFEVLGPDVAWPAAVGPLRRLLVG